MCIRDRASAGAPTFKCVTNSQILSVPKGAFLDDPCRFIRCWRTQKRAVFFPRYPNQIKLHKSSSSSSSSSSSKTRDISVSVHGKPIAQGSYGSVYRGHATSHSRRRPVVVKINIRHDKKEMRADIDEALIHVIVQCHLRSLTGSRFVFMRQNTHASVPRLLSVGSAKWSITKSVKKWQNLLVMQPLEGTVGNLLAHARVHFAPQAFRTLVNKLFRSVATTLSVLQRGLRFEHRDLHTGNIMYTTSVPKSQWSTPAGLRAFRFWIMDFGMSVVHFSEDGEGERAWQQSKHIRPSKNKSMVNAGMEGDEDIGFLKPSQYLSLIHISEPTRPY